MLSNINHFVAKKLKSERSVLSPSVANILKQPKLEESDEEVSPKRKKQRRAVIQSDSSGDEADLKDVKTEDNSVVSTEEINEKEKVVIGKVKEEEDLSSSAVKDDKSKAKNVMANFFGAKPKVCSNNSENVYKPNAKNYDPIKNASWERSEK